MALNPCLAGHGQHCGQPGVPRALHAFSPIPPPPPPPPPHPKKKMKEKRNTKQTVLRFWSMLKNSQNVLRSKRDPMWRWSQVGTVRVNMKDTTSQRKTQGSMLDIEASNRCWQAHTHTHMYRLEGARIALQIGTSKARPDVNLHPVSYDRTCYDQHRLEYVPWGCRAQRQPKHNKC